MIEIIGYEHAGIRVHNRMAAVNFYQKLGFSVDVSCTDETAIELVNTHGVRLNLICNAIQAERNILQDIPTRHAGITHIAFVVQNLEQAQRFVELNGLHITEGPKEAERRRYFFFRDSDENVIELNELNT